MQITREGNSVVLGFLLSLQSEQFSFCLTKVLGYHVKILCYCSKGYTALKKKRLENYCGIDQTSHL